MKLPSLKLVVALATAGVLSIGLLAWNFAPTLFVQFGDTHYVTIAGYSTSRIFTRQDTGRTEKYVAVPETSLTAAIMADPNLFNWLPLRVEAIDL